MANLNKVILMGNVTKNPEVRYIPSSGTPVAKFGIAVNKKYKSGDETKEDTLFVDVAAFARTAEIVGEYVTKGDPILIEGELKLQTWEQNGEKKSKHEVRANNIQMLGSKKTTKNENKTDENDIPF